MVKPMQEASLPMAVGMEAFAEASAPTPREAPTLDTNKDDTFIVKQP
jgi:hypothetical protein